MTKIEAVEGMVDIFSSSTYSENSICLMDSFFYLTSSSTKEWFKWNKSTVWLLWKTLLACPYSRFFSISFLLTKFASVGDCSSNVLKKCGSQSSIIIKGWTFISLRLRLLLVSFPFASNWFGVACNPALATKTKVKCTGKFQMKEL